MEKATINDSETKGTDSCILQGSQISYNKKMDHANYLDVLSGKKIFKHQNSYEKRMADAEIIDAISGNLHN
jgi:hypothetical protein